MPTHHFTLKSAADPPEQTTHQITSPYVEENWLPFIGPNALLLARKMTMMLQSKGASGLNLNQLSATLGIDNEDVEAALDCLIRFGLAYWDEKDKYYLLVRHWPTVPDAIKNEPHRSALLSLRAYDGNKVREDTPALEVSTG